MAWCLSCCGPYSATNNNWGTGEWGARGQASDSFKYDPFGRRIYKSSGSGASIYAYDGDNLIEKTNSTGGVVARYEQGLNIDEPLAMLQSATTSYYQADGLGSVTSLTNSTGANAETYSYDSFGNILATTGSLTNSFRYTGREFDSETSLYYYRARYYDPNSGRFLSEDSIGFAGGINFYSYVGNSSTGLVDPSGNSARLNSKSRCAQVFAKALKTGLCAGDFADALNEAASGIPIYTVHSGNSPASGLTENAVSGNGKTQTLGGPLFGSDNPPNAFTITDGSQPAIVLGPGYFNQPLDARIASLIHEEVHALTGLNDADLFALFAKYGLPDTDFKLWPHPTKGLSDWIRKGCPPK
jgi:RHS repeat-associated protein